MPTGRDISHHREATPAPSQRHGGSPPAMAAMGIQAGVIWLQSTATTAVLLAAHETQAAAGKICSEDAPRFPRWLTSIWAAEVLGEESRSRHWRGRREYLLSRPAEELSLLHTITAQVQSLYWCYMQRSCGVPPQKKEGSGGEKGDAEDCTTCIDSAVTSQLSVKPQGKYKDS